MFINTSEYLNHNLNIGGKEGAEIASENTVVKLNLAFDLLQLLNHSESSSNMLAINELLDNNFIDLR